jgi:hypothetical protein
MTEPQPGATEDAERRAAGIINCRREYFRCQQMIREHEDAQARARAEETLDDLISLIRRNCAQLMAAVGRQVASTGVITAAQARLILIANGADEETMSDWHERPEFWAQLFTNYFSLGSGDPGYKLTELAGAMMINADPDFLSGAWFRELAAGGQPATPTQNP